MVLAVKVLLEDAEEIRECLIEEDILDKKHLYSKNDSHIWFPVKEEFSSSELEAEITFEDKDLEEAERRKGFKDLLEEELSEEEIGKVYTSYDVLGDIAVIKVPEELEEKEKLIGDCLLKASPQVKTVLKKESSRSGEFRTCSLTHLAGEKKKEAVVTENNVDIKVDLERVYFSVRMAGERKRVYKQVQDDERVLVMFSGVAPYPCVICKNTEAGEVVGVEKNPVAHKYGLENVELNNLENVKLHRGDVEDVVPNLEGQFHRIVMPAPYNASNYLEVALEKVKEGGVIHYYTFLEEGEFEEGRKMVREAVGSLSSEKKLEFLRTVKCGQHSPSTYRTCIEFRVF